MTEKFVSTTFAGLCPADSRGRLSPRESRIGENQLWTWHLDGRSDNQAVLMDII